MAECLITKKALPERNVHFIGFECRNKDRYCCPNYRYSFLDGTNCQLLRKPRNVETLLRRAENV